MKLLPVFAAAVTIAVPAALPQSHTAWRYIRAITPASGAPEAEQCVVLDADTFSHAASGLRDLRLLQDGREIPYALDESHDAAFDRASASSGAQRAAPASNRAQYETSLLIPVHPLHWAGTESNGSRIRPEHPPGWFYGEDELPAHVPVERIRILPEIDASESVSLSAWQGKDQRDRESLEATLTPQIPAVNFTIGANLQTNAGIHVGVNGAMPVIQAFVLEMRRRELCFQPLSRAPLFLLLGNEKARPIRYAYARNFHPSPSPLLAVLRPVQPNPDSRVGVSIDTRKLTLNQILFAIYTGCAAVVLLNLLLFQHKAR